MEEIKKQLLSLQKHIKEAKRLLQRYQSLKEKSPDEAILLLQRIREKLILLSIDAEEKIKKEHDALIEIQKRKEEEFGRRLSVLLPNLCGNYPRYYWRLYSIEVEGKSANVFWGPEPVGKAKKMPEDIARLIKGFEEKLMKGMDIEDFHRKLLLAYKKVGREKARILDVLLELVFILQPPSFQKDPRRALFSEYTRAQFGHDLYRLRKEKPDAFTLYVATFDATKDKARSLFVPDNEMEGTYYAYICMH